MNKLIIKNILFRYIIIFLVMMFIFSSSCIAFDLYGNENSQTREELKWLAFDQALTKSTIESIPTLIYFYSDNCSWCRKLENETFSNQGIAEIMNDNFAIVKIDSNSTDLINVNGQKIAENKLSQDVFQVRGNPTIWFLDSNENRITSLPGYVPADDFLNILEYIKEDYYKKYSWSEYMENIVNNS